MAVKVVWPTAELEKASLDTEEELRQFGVEFIQECNNQVVAATPVKTGWLQNSWFGALNSPPKGAAGAGGGAGNMNSAVEGFAVGDVYYAVNTAEYAAYVEYGTRKMTPRAFVRGTLSDGNVKTIAAMVAARIKASFTVK